MKNSEDEKCRAEYSRKEKSKEVKREKEEKSEKRNGAERLGGK